MPKNRATQGRDGQVAVASAEVPGVTLTRFGFGGSMRSAALRGRRGTAIALQPLTLSRDSLRGCARVASGRMVVLTVEIVRRPNPGQSKQTDASEPDTATMWPTVNVLLIGKNSQAIATSIATDWLR